MKKQSPAGDHPSAVMLWDGDCGFCYQWIRRWRKLTGDTVAYRAYQEVLSDYPQLQESECKEAVKLVFPDGRVLSAAHAVLTSLALGGRCRWMLRLYDCSRTFRRVTESLYRFVARNRNRLPR